MSKVRGPEGGGGSPAGPIRVLLRRVHERRRGESPRERVEMGGMRSARLDESLVNNVPRGIPPVEVTPSLLAVSPPVVPSSDPIEIRASSGIDHDQVLSEFTSFLETLKSSVTYWPGQHEHRHSNMSLWPSIEMIRRQRDDEHERLGLDHALIVGGPIVIPYSTSLIRDRIDHDFFMPFWSELSKLERMDSSLGSDFLTFFTFLRDQVWGVLNRYDTYEQAIRKKFGFITPPLGSIVTKSTRARFRHFCRAHGEGETPPEVASLFNSALVNQFLWGAIKYDFEPKGWSLLTSTPSSSLHSRDRLLDTQANITILDELDQFAERLEDLRLPPRAARVYDRKEYRLAVRIESSIVLGLRASLEEHINAFFSSMRTGYIISEGNAVFTATNFGPLDRESYRLAPCDSLRLVDAPDKYAIRWLQKYPKFRKRIKEFSPRLWLYLIIEESDLHAKPEVAPSRFKAALSRIIGRK